MRRLFTAAFVAIALLAPGLSASAQDQDPKKITKPISRMIKAIRFEKYALAGRSIDYAAMSADVLQNVAEDMSDAQKAEFQAGYRYLMENLSFVKAHEKFEYLDDISYEEPVLSGGKARVKSVIVIYHDLKKEEIALEYVMVPSGENWRIFDVLIEGESTLEGVREDQIEELVDEGGVEHLMTKLREKVAEVKADREG